MKKTFSILISLILIYGLKAQDTSRPLLNPDPAKAVIDTTQTIIKAQVVDGDTLPVVELGAAIIFPEIDFKNARELLKYDRLVYNVRKVYPYAKLAGIKLTEYKNILDTITNERQKKLFIKKAQKELEDQFEDELKALTFSQGKVLIKLIYRETGNSSYDIVKDLRGGFTAFILQSMAKLFGYDLKTQYLPENEDKAIERIVQMIEAGAF